MGEDCGAWVPQLHLDWQSPILSSSRAPREGKQTGVSAFMNPSINTMVMNNEAMPAYASTMMPYLQLRHSKEPPHGWSYCLPRFWPAPNFSVEGKLPAGQAKGFSGETVPHLESQKQFLVMDQAGDQTTFIYRLGLDSWHSKRHCPDNLNRNEPLFRRDVNNLIGASFPTKVDESRGRDMESEMHEDTEEINALLYSDSDGYSAEDEDEVTSTGHSPSTMTTHDSQEIFRVATEEAGSSAGKSRKRKLSECAYDDTATSLNLNLKRPYEYENGDDAESICSCGSGEMGSLSGNEKTRKEKIRDVLSVLQSIIPGGKDKDPIVLLDEAIRCLKFLKFKARALGFDAS